VSIVDSSTCWTGLHVEEVIEKSLVPGDVRRLRSLRCVVEESQGIQRPLRRVRSRYVTALDAHWIRRQRETDRGDARETLRRPTVRRESVVGIGTLPEPIECPALQCIEKGGLANR